MAEEDEEEDEEEEEEQEQEQEEKERISIMLYGASQRITHPHPSASSYPDKLQHIAGRFGAGR